MSSSGFCKCVQKDMYTLYTQHTHTKHNTPPSMFMLTTYIKCFVPFLNVFVEVTGIENSVQGNPFCRTEQYGWLYHVLYAFGIT